MARELCPGHVTDLRWHTREEEEEEELRDVIRSNNIARTPLVARQ